MELLTGMMADTLHNLSSGVDEKDDDSMGSEIDDVQNDKNVFDASVEERFRVDRRKLEQMIQGTANKCSMFAEDFFLQIMEETDTHITWPSRLKIGAKSKKDPYIKVVGTYENVAAAKEKIMSVLDSKSTRVTLKMDVSHMEHSHVIGKGGSNIKQVMQESGCHIHFPDSNRNNQAEKSNQVSIAGQPNGVEMARIKIRELLPLVFLFELPMSALLIDLSSPVIQQIQQRYDISVSFKQRPQAYSTTMMVRGTVKNAKAIKEATALLVEHLTGNVGHMVSVSMQIEIAPQHHLFMMGKGGANVRQIMQHTGASIHFPDPATVPAQRRGIVYVTGLIESVYQARQQLIGCLPLILMFDVKEDITINQALITHLMERLDVFISIKQKPKQLSKLVIVKSVEQNAASLYVARQKLLGIEADNQLAPPIETANQLAPQLPQQTIFNESLVSSIPPASPSSLNGLTFHSYGMMSQSPVFGLEQSPVLVVNGLASPLPSPASQLTPVINASQSLYSPVMVLGPQPFTVHNFPVCIGQPTVAGTMPSQISTSVKLTSQQQTQSNVSSVLPQAERVVISVGSLRSSSDSTSSSPSSSSSGQNQDLNTLSSSIGLRPIMGRSASHEASISETLSSLITKGPTMTPFQSHSTAGLVDMARQYGRDAEAVSVASDRSLLDLLMSQSSASIRTSTHQSGSVLSHRSSSSMDLYGGRSSSLAYVATAAGSITAPGSPLSCSRTSLADLNLPRSTELSWQPQFDALSTSKWPKLGGVSELLAGCNIFDELDYENKKLLANKAMSKKPSGESRVPTDFWSGLGFSKSMPDTAIRERLRENNISQGNGPINLPCNLEVDETELDIERWADLSTRSSIFECPQELVTNDSVTNSTNNGSNLLLTSAMSGMSNVSPAPGGFPSPRKKGNDLAGLSRSNYIDNSILHRPIDCMPCTDLAELFSKLGLGKYTDLFQQQEIDLATFVTLTDKDLKELGITTFGARRKMLLAIADLSKRQSLMSAAPGSNNPYRNVGNQKSDASLPW